MEMITTSETIDPARLGKEERERFIRELYAVQCQIFEGVDEKSFSSYIFHPNAARTRIKIFRNDQREMVVYSAIHQFEMRSVGAQPTAVFRSEAGLLFPYRRKHSTISFTFAEFCRYKCLHPIRKLYFLGILVHPSSYHLVFRHSYEMYPTYRRETPPHILHSMCDIAKNFGIEPVFRNNALVVPVGSRVQNDRKAMEYWSHCNKQDVTYFLKVNPDYLKGEGLLTLVPLSWKNLLWMFISWMIEAGRRLVRKE